MPELETAVEDVVQEQAKSTPENAFDQAKKESANEPVEITLSTDIKDIPEALKGIHKSMQADYTKKTTELADQRKALESKASAFDELTNNPQFSEILDNIQKFGTPTPPKNQTQIKELTGEEVLLRILENPRYLDQLIEEKARAITSPLTEKEAEREANTVYATFTEKYPDFKEYDSELEEFVKGLPESVSQAQVISLVESKYKALSFDKLQEKNDSLEKDSKREKAASLSRTTSAKPTPSQGKMSMHQAFQLAQKEHGL